MHLPETALPVPMRRVAVVALQQRLRDALVVIADAGCIQLAGGLPPLVGPEVDALRRLERTTATRGDPHLSPETPDLATLEVQGAWPELAGEAELARRAAAAVQHGPVAAIVGWMPATDVERVRGALAAVGASLVDLAEPRWLDPPTLLRPARAARAFRPLVDTYGAPAYRDLDPTLFTAITFVLMFGMMFGDVAHGLALMVLALLLRRTSWARLTPFRALWPLPAAAGASAALFGLAYGEAFGPTHLVPTLWLAPLDDPIRLLEVAICVGAVLLTVGYAVGTVNRYRERGAQAALLAASGVAGFLLLLSGALLLIGWELHAGLAEKAGIVLALVALVLLSIGFLRSAGRGGVAIAEATVEVLDTVLRVAGNTVSFARLAAFGLVHAAIGGAVLAGARVLWGGGPAGMLAAAVLFAAGNVVAFSLEALVATVQALRLEYYELFSRVFAGEGHPFSPWRLPVNADRLPRPT